MSKNIIIISVLLFSAACTQQPAPIALKGQESFAKSGSSTNGRYATGQDPSVYMPAIEQETHQDAHVDSITSSDLAPPQKTASTSTKSTNSPFSSAPAVKNEGTAEVSSNNPWTNKPRDLLEQKSSPESYNNPASAPDNDSELKWPVSSRKIVSAFGANSSGTASDGVTIAASEGEAVHAAAAGEVIYTGDKLNGYGNMVIIKHSGGKNTTYANLSRLAVDKYSRVSQGDVIGYTGTKSAAKAPQLFFSLRDGSKTLDPTKYVSNEIAGL